MTYGYGVTIVDAGLVGAQAALVRLA